MTNNEIKYLKSLQQKKYRDQNQSFVVEGPKIISEIIRQKVPFRRIFYTDDAPSFIKKQDFLHIKRAEMERISGLKSPSNCLAELDFFNEKSPDIPQNEFYLGLDRIQDPGNLGTIIRICDWFGINQIICNKDTCELYNPKVIQSSMGGIFRVEVVYTDLMGYCKVLVDSEISIISSALNGDEMNSIAPMTSGLLLMGNESKGLSVDLQNLSSNKVKIKGEGKAESLNVSVAAGILVNWLKNQ